MNEYDNTNTGAIFVNDKAGNDKRPDRKGSLNVEGVDYWIRKDKNGNPYMSLKVERKEAKPESKPQSDHNRAKADAFQPQGEDDFDDIPF